MGAILAMTHCPPFPINFDVSNFKLFYILQKYMYLPPFKLPVVNITLLVSNNFMSRRIAVGCITILSKSPL